LTLRTSTERPVTIEQGTNVLVGLDSNKIVSAARRALESASAVVRIPDLWDGRAAARIADILLLSR
jgi:UDP-N-acetylglucosamine 2-epimerase (non-hydrolysing)